MRSSARLIGTSIVLMALVGSQMGTALADPTEPGGTFTDDNGSVHEGFIEAIAMVAITRGCNPPFNDRFCPDEPVTRGQMAAFLTRSFPLGDESASYVDAAGHTFESEIGRLGGSGITRGCNPPVNDRFCPDEQVTRGQMAAFLVRTMELVGSDSNFADTDGHIFESEIAALAGAGITLGCNPPANDLFCPDQVVTRGQMATFLGRSLHLEPIVPPPAPCVDINTAPSTELVEIIHISEVRAAELIMLRPFSSVNDMVRIDGIGLARLADIKAQGLAQVGCP